MHMERKCIMQPAVPLLLKAVLVLHGADATRLKGWLRVRRVRGLATQYWTARYSAQTYE